jgi:hypothetical protein
MKKTILIITVFAISLFANAQVIEKDNKEKDKIYYSFVWGLFKSKDYPKNKLSDFEASNQISKIKVKSSLDSSIYEPKSILWGAIQWSEKKNNQVKKLK